VTPELAALLPTRDGVGPSVIALPPGNWPLVLDYLAYRFPTIPREEIASRMQRGDVRDESGQFVLPDAVYRAHRKLYYYRRIDDEPRIPPLQAVDGPFDVDGEIMRDRASTADLRQEHRS